MPTPSKSTKSPISIATDTINLLTSSNTTLSIAESLTGDAIMSTLTALPGVGSVFHGGIVAYDTPLKITALSVDKYFVDGEGVVHPDVAAQMARGGVRWGLATTGVAEPGKQDGKDMGTGEGGKGGRGIGRFWFPGTREGVIEGAVGDVEGVEGVEGGLMEWEGE
ncbi:hypothetical protein B0T14DRAFT_540167 [Immersiella caudata]|uniref:CinA C-terminal domain-containing protein n=1 Tax=Immersiella caudata TaxID=314043 RepID=A0AA39WBW1_9PEZI|nr:hypothetical protein B0T14DRAFT_540167 [Immersiella caudata]